MALTTAGMNKRRNLLFETSGAQTLTAKQLTDLVAREKILAYWLGISNASQCNLVIETSGVRGIPGALFSSESEVSNATDLTVTGNAFSYDRSFGEAYHEVITLQNIFCDLS